ncbi:MAG: dephospho-CoA kinase [Armatimonadetes bacterium RBG_16_67_12]|nr:MAG: dephospho-CoA kinase [Armatimonadetes bacterium RBG_16_67_12]
MKVIGLTGGIASGKSLVYGFLRDLGAHVIDADAVAREVVTPGSEALAEIAAAFGSSVLRPDGTLDRKAVADRIFRDPNARLTLNTITHPRIRRRIAEEIEQIGARSPAAVVVVDIPLLLDVAPRDAYPLDGIVVVFTEESTQRARVMARDGLTEDEARQRLASQRPLHEKVAEATWVIDNSGPPEATRRQVEALWHELQHGLDRIRG